MSGKARIQTQILQPPESVLASHVGVLSAELQLPQAHPGECSGGVPWRVPPRPAMRFSPSQDCLGPEPGPRFRVQLSPNWQG